MTKKGAVISSTDPKIVTKIRSLNPKWYYTWGPTAVLGLEDIPFTPMCWGSNSVSKLGTQVPVLLGFNEPDRPDQSNLTPQQAFNLWPKLESLGSRLGVPPLLVTHRKLVHGWKPFPILIQNSISCAYTGTPHQTSTHF